MSSGAERRVTLKLAIVADGDNAKAAAAVNKTVQDTMDRQTAAAKKTADAKAKSEAQATAAAQKEYDRQANEALKAYSRIMREKDKQAAEAVKAEAKQTAAAQKAYDSQVRDAQKAYSAILREREKNAAAIERESDRAMDYGKKTAKASTQALGGVIGVAQGFATLGLLSEESTEGLLRGLVKVQGTFTILRELVNIYDDVTDAIEFATKAAKANAAAQALVSATSKGGAVSKVATTAGTAVATGAAQQTATAVAAGGLTAAAVALKGILVAVGSAVWGVVAAFGPFVALATAGGLALFELVSWLGRLAGFNTESFVGAILGWRKAADDAAKSTKKLEDAEKKAANAKEILAIATERAAERDQVIRQAQGFRGVIAQFQSVAKNQNETDALDQQRAAQAAEVRAEEQRLAAARAERERGLSTGVVSSNAAVEASAQRLAEQQQRLVELDQQRFQNAKQLQQTQAATVQSLKEQYAEARKLVASEKERYQSTLARVGALSNGERDQAAKIAAAIKAGQDLTKAQIKFAEERNLFTAQIERQRAKEGGSTEAGRLIAEVDTGGQAAIREAEQKAREIAEQLYEAQDDLDKTTRRVNDSLVDFRDNLAKLPKLFQDLLDMAAAKTSGVRESSTSAGPDVQAAGKRAADAQDQLKTAMIESLDAIEKKTMETVDELRARQQRGSLVQNVG